MGGFGRKALGSVSVAVLRRERLGAEARSDRSGAALPRILAFTMCCRTLLASA